MWYVVSNKWYVIHEIWYINVYFKLLYILSVYVTSPSLSGTMILKVWLEIPTIPSMHSCEENPDA